VKASDNPVVGRWRIVQADLWDQDHLDLCGPATLVVKASGHGEIAFGAMQASLDIDYGSDETDHHRELAASLQHGAAARVAGLSTARAGGVCARLRRWPALSTHRSLGGTAHPALTSTPDHRMGAGHSASSSRNLRVARCGGGLG